MRRGKLNITLMIKKLKKDNIFISYSLYWLGAILSCIFILIIKCCNSIFIDKTAIMAGILLLVIISTYLGGKVSGILSLCILSFGLEMNYTTAQLVSQSISMIVVIFFVLHIKVCSDNENLKLKSDKKMYKFILDCIPEGVIVRQKYKILYKNKWFKKQFNNKENKGSMVSIILKHLNNKNKDNMKPNLKHSEYLQLHKNDGAFEYLKYNSSAIFVKDEGKDAFNKDEESVLSTVSVVTEEVKRIKFIKESKKRCKQILSILPLGVLMHVDDKIIFANNEITKILRYGNYKFLIGEDIKKFIIHKNRSDFHDNIQKINDGNKTEPLEIEMLDNDGNMLSVEVFNSMVPFQKDAVLTIIKNITEKKQREEERLILKETTTYEKIKSEFFANISHELKTPVNVICSSLQVINYLISLNEIIGDTEKLVDYINVMKQNCYRELKLSNNLIDLSRYEMNGLNLNLNRVNIVSLIESLVEEVAKVAIKKNIRLIFDTEEEEIICDIDEIKIERMILNLLSNSIKFTQAGGEILVYITTKRKYVIITVKDNGIGIPKGKINYIFDRFKQLDKSFARKTEGSGLGLSIVKAIINLHGGNIKMESEYGLGTEVNVSLPYEIEAGQMIMNIDNIFKDCSEIINIELSDLYL